MANLDDISRLDPVVKAGYNMYKAAKKDGSENFIDFLLKYNSNEANNGDFSSVLGEKGKVFSDLISNVAASAKAVSSAISSDESLLKSLSAKNFALNPANLELLSQNPSLADNILKDKTSMQDLFSSLLNIDSNTETMLNSNIDSKVQKALKTATLNEKQNS
ncbi:MAG: hypothetical protein K5978_06240 [Campylobacter sp.]|nr:hypothetical protein [Campylobacter sp.]